MGLFSSGRGSFGNESGGSVNGRHRGKPAKGKGGINKPTKGKRGSEPKGSKGRGGKGGAAGGLDRWG
jgi:hypothetical protein